MLHIQNKMIERRTDWLAWFICLLAAIFYCYEFLLRVSPSVMNTQLMHAYHLNARGFGNLVSYYYYVYAPMQLFVGLLMDRYGPRRLLTMALGCCFLGSALFANGHYLSLAELGRFLIGFGSAFAFVGVLKLATIWLPTRWFAMISGLTVSLGMLGGILGDVVLTKLVASQGWRESCYFASIFGFILMLVVFALVRDSNGVSSVRVIKKIPSFRVAWPYLLVIVRNPQVWLNGMVGCLLYLPVSAFAESWAIPYLKNVYHFSSISAGNLTAMIFLGWAIGSPIVGFISDRIAQRRLPITIGASIATVLMVLIIYAPMRFSVNQLYVLFLCFGVFSSVQILVFSIGKELSPTALSGTALSITNMMVMLAGFGVYFVGYLLSLLWSGAIQNGVHVYHLRSYQVALSLLPLGLFLSILLTFFLKETHAKEVANI